MHHLHIDRFAAMNSPVHRMDPRAKIVAALAFVLASVLTPDGFFLSFALYGAVITAVVIASRVPPAYLFERSLLLVPFALAVSVFVPFITPGTVVTRLPLGFMEADITREGLIRFSSIGLKALLSFMAMITLVSTTRFVDLVRAASSLGFPAKLAEVLTFMYRYLFIFIDDASHMALARDLRSGAGRRLSFTTASGGIVGALFVRSYEHAERLYYAMLLRGYSGHPQTLHPMRLRTRDILFAALMTAAVACCFALGGLVHG